MDTTILISIAEIGFYLAVIAGSIYGLVFAYHWFSYGSSHRSNMTAIIILATGMIISLVMMWLGMNKL